MAEADSESTHYRICTLCEAMCGIRIETHGDQIRSIRGDTDDPFSKGYICPKAPALQALHEDPDRLRRPLRRQGTEWEEIPWDEALDRAAAGVRKVQQRHGRDAVSVYVGNPMVHSTGALLYAPTFLRALKTRNRYSASSADQMPQHVVAHAMFGHQLLLPIPDVDRTDYFVIIGGNPAVSNGSIMSAPDMGGRIRAIHQRGGKTLVIDPRRTETAEIADEHLFVRPGTDAWLLAALVRLALQHGRGLGRMAGAARSLQAVQRAVEPFTPERAAEMTGIGADDIRRIASELCGAERAACYGRIGVSTHRFGTLCHWLINVLNLVTGNFDEPGGVMFPTPALDLVMAPDAMGIPAGSHARWRSRVRGLPEVNGELPVAAWAEEMLTPGEGQVRGAITMGGNPVLSTPNGPRLDEGLKQLEWMVSVDYYLNETTRHADVILPPPSQLERSHYDVVFPLLAVRNTAKYSSPLFEPPPDAVPEWKIFAELTRRLLSGRGPWSLRAQAAFMRRLGPEGLLSLGLGLGPRGWRAPREQRATLRRLQKQPHGMDLGPLQQTMPERLRTPDNTIELAPKLVLEDVERLLAAEQSQSDAELSDGVLRLIGRRQLRSNNSWMHNVPKLVAGKPRCTLMMHPSDASARGLADGAEVEIRSRVGSVRAPLELSESIMRGVVSLPHGFGHHRQGVRLSVATEVAGVSINDLTDDAEVDGPSGNAAFNGIEVTVQASA